MPFTLLLQHNPGIRRFCRPLRRHGAQARTGNIHAVSGANIAVPPRLERESKISESSGSWSVYSWSGDWYNLWESLVAIQVWNFLTSGSPNDSGVLRVL